jgi:pimeloyl-ACP methyl ester carboxylesterase
MAKQKINWLLLRGLTREKSHWGAFLPLLKKRFPDSQVFCLDHPGTGTENERPSPFHIAAITDDLRARWKKSFSKSKLGDWAILGHSLGGMVALDWQERYSKDFIGCVLMNTSARGAGPFWNRVKPKALLEIGKVAAARSPRAREEIVLRLTSNLETKNKKVLEDWIQFAHERPLHPMTGLRQLSAAAAFRARFPSKVPLAFLASKQDKLVDPACSETLAQRYSSQIRFHSKAGHDLTLDDPNWVADQLSEFAANFLRNAN